MVNKQTRYPNLSMRFANLDVCEIDCKFSQANFWGRQNLVIYETKYYYFVPVLTFKDWENFFLTKEIG